MAKKMSLRAAYIGFGKGFEEMKSEVLELREENKRLRAALELYRGQIDNAGKHSAADALSSNAIGEGPGAASCARSLSTDGLERKR